MLIKVKTNYGHAENGLVKLKTPKMQPFHVSDEKGQELIARGIAVKIADDEPAAEATAEATAPAEATAEATTEATTEATAPAENEAVVVPYEDMTRPELLEIAKGRGLDVDTKTKKQDLINALKEATK